MERSSDFHKEFRKRAEVLDLQPHNYYGGLIVYCVDNKYYWGVEDYWGIDLYEISENLFNELKKCPPPDDDD